MTAYLSPAPIAITSPAVYSFLSAELTASRVLNKEYQNDM